MARKDGGLRMLSVRVGDEVFDRLDQLCASSEPKTTRSEMIRRALSVGIAALEQRDKRARQHGQAD